MTTTGKPASRQRYEHRYFSGMAMLILLAVFAGFAHTYYLAGLFRAPLPNLLVHLHGAVFTLWILLFITQTSLVAAGRVDLHRRLGIFGVVVACLLVMLGVLAATEQMANQDQSGSAGIGSRSFYAVLIADLVMFATLTGFAFRMRFKPVAHKRLMLVATLSILDAAYDRWPVPVPWWDDRVTPLICTYPLLLLLMAYDWWSTRTVQRVTLWATAFLVVIQQGRDPFGHTALWQNFASWVYAHSHSWWIFHRSV
jgi:hypothetical protein